MLTGTNAEVARCIKKNIWHVMYQHVGKFVKVSADRLRHLCSCLAFQPTSWRVFSDSTYLCVRQCRHESSCQLVVLSVTLLLL